MRILLDTNLPLRLAEPGHKHHKTAVDAIIALELRSDDLVLVPQNLYEYWVVATRPIAVGGLGLTPQETAAKVAALRSKYAVLLDPANLLDRWLSLVMAYGVRGKPAHDARLVAAMQFHGISHILTFNTADFRRYAGITALDPADVAAGAVP